MKKNLMEILNLIGENKMIDWKLVLTKFLKTGSLLNTVTKRLSWQVVNTYICNLHAILGHVNLYLLDFQSLN